MSDEVNFNEVIDKKMQSVKQKISELREINKKKNQVEAEINLELAEIYNDIKKSENNKQLSIEYTKIRHNNLDVLKNSEIERDASQLIKIEKIKEYTMLGWPKLLYIRKYKPKMDRFDIDEVNENFGSINDRINLESYIIYRILAKNNILNIDKNIIKNYVKTGLKAEHLTSSAIKELKDKDVINQTNVLRWIRYRAFKNEVNRSVSKIKNPDASVAKMINEIEMILKQEEELIKLKESKKTEVKSNIDEAKVHDLLVRASELHDKVQFLNDFKYELGVFTYGNKDSTDEKINNDAINEILSEMEDK